MKAAPGIRTSAWGCLFANNTHCYSRTKLKIKKSAINPRSLDSNVDGSLMRHSQAVMNVPAILAGMSYHNPRPQGSSRINCEGAEA